MAHPKIVNWPRVLIPDMQVESETLAVNMFAEQILPYNPDRICLIFANPGTNQVNVWLQDDVSSTNGFIINPGENPTVFNYSDFGAIVQQPWYAIGGFVGGSLTIVQTFFNPLMRS